MNGSRADVYANMLSQMLQHETVSKSAQTDLTKFRKMRELLEELFPTLFSTSEIWDFDGSLLLKISGNGEDLPIMLMNHQDVVEAEGEWKYPPYSGTVADGKIWGRGALDTKCGLFGMLMAAEELLKEGYTPARDVYLLSSCTEECDGSGAKKIALELKSRGIRFHMIMDEGGMIVTEPIAGARGKFAMIGVGEKGACDLKFTARSIGGHASTPGKDTPLARIGKFICYVESHNIFSVKLSKTVKETFRRLSLRMDGPMKHLLRHCGLLAPILCLAMPKVSAAAGAMLKTTVAFTMAEGSARINVLPSEASVSVNMRFSHHEGGAASIEKMIQAANRFGLETEILRSGEDSPISDFEGEAFRGIEGIISEIFPEVLPVPYVMNAASDSRFMGELSDSVLRFAPFTITKEQLASVHGVNENLDVSTLPDAVDFYKKIIEKI